MKALFKELNFGDKFVFQDVPYIVAELPSSSDAGAFNVVNLDTGMPGHFPGTLEVNVAQRSALTCPGSPLSFDDLRTANVERQNNWPGAGNVDLPFSAIEVGGECGELLESIKKYLRAERGIKGSTATLKDVANEAADVIIAVDLLAMRLGFPLGAAVTSKFNDTSKKYGLSVEIPEPLSTEC